MLKPGSIRFILATIVIFYHITKLVFLGEFAVLCFFMLSGYWITYMYQNKYSKFKSSLGVFYVSRIWRLFPVFLLFNGLTFLICYIFKPQLIDVISTHTGHLQIFYWIPNFLMFGYNLINPPVLVTAWSLDIEFQFYLIYPILIITLIKEKYKPLIIFLIVTLVITIYYPNNLVQKTLLYYLFYFLVGMTIYLKDLTFSKNTSVFATATFLFVLILNFIIPDLRKLTVGNNASSYNTHLNEILPLLVLPLLCNSLKNKSTKLDRVLGNMSFVLYLCHWTLIIPYNYFIKDLTALQRLPYSAVYLLFTFTLSYFIYYYFDEPIDDLRKKWVASREMIKHEHLTAE